MPTSHILIVFFALWYGDNLILCYIFQAGCSHCCLRYRRRLFGVHAYKTFHKTHPFHYMTFRFLQHNPHIFHIITCFSVYHKPHAITIPYIYYVVLCAHGMWSHFAFWQIYLVENVTPKASPIIFLYM